MRGRLSRVALAVGITLGGGSLAVAASSPGVAGATTTNLHAPHVIAPHAAKPKAAHPATHASTRRGQTAPAVSSTAQVPQSTPAAQTFSVDTTTDLKLATSSSTTCTATTATGKCSLRAAVEAANNDTGHIDTISVPAGTYNLSNAATFGTIDVTNSMIIAGTGGPVVSGQTATEVLDIFSSTPGFRPAVEISGMTIENGSWDTGGDIYSTGAALTLSGTTVSGGKATTNGGGLFLTGGALWTDSSTVISGNSAKYGGGLYDTYTSVFIGGSTFASNTASTAGGAVYQTGNLVSENATYTKNSSPDGGVFYNDWTMSDSGSTYSGSSLTGSEEYGSVIDNDDAASISNATVTSSSSTANVSNLYGGVFYNTENSVLSLTHDSVTGTSNPCTDCDLYGGVVYNYKGNVNVSGLTVSNTTNGTPTGDPYIEGGVLTNTADETFGELHITGLTVSSTSNATSTDEIYGGVIDGEYGGQTQVSDATITGTNDNDTSGSDDIYGGVTYFTEFATGTITTLSISNTTVKNADSEVYGGALYVTTTTPTSVSGLSITGTTVTVGGADVYGGAVYTTTARVSVKDMTITTTKVHDTGTGDGYVEGGAWYNGDDLSATNVQVLGTTVTSDDEVFGGAFSNDGDLATITNGTFARTTTTMVGTGTDGAFGGAFNTNDQMTMVNVTIDTNTTKAPHTSAAATVYLDTSSQFVNDTIANDTETSTDGSPFTGTAGGVVIDSGYAEYLKNTIVATTPSTLNCVHADATASFVSAGGNIDSGVSCGFGQSSDQYATNPMVNPVANNSGPVETASLQASSPAIGHGVSAGCPATDARGVARTGGCDVGAFQTSTQGYWEVASDGGIFTFGTATFHGSEGGVKLNAPVVGMAATPTGGGYWEVAADGGVFTFGNATYYGSMGSKHLNDPIVGMAAAPTGHGYWLAASDGGIFAFGSALFHGSKGGQPLNAPVVGIAADPTGNGYWEVASDGGIFNYGSAGFFGSKGGQPLNAPVDNIAAAPTGNGYTLVASDGGIFNYGSAGFFGSKGGQHLNAPMVGVSSTATGQGYWEFASDGGVFTYGTAAFLGSMGGTTLNAPVVGGAALTRR